MRPNFAQSAETAAIVSFFLSIPIGREVSWKEASKSVGFTLHSSLPAYQSAKIAAARDHRVVIDGIRGFGFKRIDGSGMVSRAARFFKKVRKGARRESCVQEIAMSTNLTREEMLAATEQLSRLRILQTTA